MVSISRSKFARQNKLSGDVPGTVDLEPLGAKAGLIASGFALAQYPAARNRPLHQSGSRPGPQ